VAPAADQHRNDDRHLPDALPLIARSDRGAAATRAVLDERTRASARAPKSLRNCEYVRARAARALMCIRTITGDQSSISG